MGRIDYNTIKAISIQKVMDIEWKIEAEGSLPACALISWDSSTDHSTVPFPNTPNFLNI